MNVYRLIVGSIFACIYGVSLYYILSDISTLSRGQIGAITAITAGLLSYILTYLIRVKKINGKHK